MLNYIKSQYTRLWNNPYRYYDAIDSDMTSYFGVMTLFSTFFGIALAAVGIADIAGKIEGCPMWIGIVMLILGVISVATCIIYCILSDYLADNSYIEEYDPHKILIIVDTTIMQLCSGMFIILLAIGIVIETFTFLLYTMPLMIIKTVIKNKADTKINKDNKVNNINKIKQEFLSYTTKCR